MILKDKTIAFLGDSITEGNGVGSGVERYDNAIKEKCGLKAVFNYGIGGTRISHQEKPSDKPRHDLCFCGRAYDVCKDADALVVFGGTNDYGHGDAPFGTLNDRKPNTFCGAVHWLMTYLLSEFPNKPIVFLTPARRVGDEKPANHPNKKPDAKPLIDYVDVIIAKAKELGVGIVDFYRDLPINPNIPEDKERYTVDGLHLNAAGHKLMADLVIDCFEKL